MDEITLCRAPFKCLACVADRAFPRNPHSTPCCWIWQMTKFWTMEGERNWGEAVPGQSWLEEGDSPLYFLFPSHLPGCREGQCLGDGRAGRWRESWSLRERQASIVYDTSVLAAILMRPSLPWLTLSFFRFHLRRAFEGLLSARHIHLISHILTTDIWSVMSSLFFFSPHMESKAQKGLGNWQKAACLGSGSSGKDSWDRM